MLPSFLRRRSSSEARPGLRRYVVVPAARGPATAPCDVARHLLGAARLHAEGCARAPVGLLAVEAGTGRARPLDLDSATPRAAALSPADWRGSDVIVLMNVASLLADPPPLDTLTARAELVGWALSGQRSTRDTQAFAFIPARTPGSVVAAALRHLVACLGDDVEALWRDASAEPLVPAAPALVDNSPALHGVSGAWARRLPESPRYLNTALLELLGDPAEHGPIDADPARLARALVAQRERSRVPWIFNTLLSDLEYRLGTAAPASFPPELHLSLAGACHLECRLCGDAHDEARFDRVTPADVERLDFLRHARVLRLHSGLDEPTLDAHLPAIVAATAERHPHLGLHLFTSGVSLHKPGVIPTLAGRARWVTVALNAATRETWRELCTADLFEQVCRNVKELTRVKRERRTLFPLLFGTAVLNRANIDELPRLPKLCRELGIDRLAGFPLYASQSPGRGRLGANDTLDACRRAYDAVYDETVREAERHHVSLELPAPAATKRTSFGLEPRPLFDFARIETSEWTLGRLLGTLRFETSHGAHCEVLWRQAAVGHTRRASAAQAETRYLYPCLAPLCHADLSARTALRWPGAAGYLELWRHPVFEQLRRAQHDAGMSALCDACRTSGTRDPRRFRRLSELVAEFEAELSGARATLSA